ncbi:DnaJ subfamily C member 17 [Orchesella cincta]|uniref:DnaJ homolog subfamily C member 17 n=1 Tax=Orchesella cincta TaxID=48709 RepID=A0A1D2N6V3_ORCCI|nr:DnaJ subfamily C member 17 [Orchesella cincta]
MHNSVVVENMAQKRKITDQNLYELFGVLGSATEQDIKKAYRKKALKCHPDKNPDNPKAAELFHELSEALGILTDVKAREAYDRTLKAKEQAKERHRELDAKRKKLKEDLERREQAAKEDAIARASAKKQYSTAASEEENLQKQVDRLRKEGSRALREEQELIRQQILKEQEGKFSFLSAAPDAGKDAGVEGPRIKVKWGKNDSPKSYDNLIKIFSKYGKVTTLVVGKKSAIVEFESQTVADKAFEGEGRNNSNEMQLEWISKATSNGEQKSSASSDAVPVFKPNPIVGGQGFPTTTKASNTTQPMSASSFADFEAMILGKLSAAAAAQKQNPPDENNLSLRHTAALEDFVFVTGVCDSACLDPTASATDL